ncbi:MAG: hypothetical protein AB2535_19125 [Candidatus Thiodiazotropha endolucinida]
MSQTTQSPQTADFSALEVGGQLNDATIDYMQPISGSEQSDLGAYLAAPQPMTNTQGSSTPSRIGAPAPDDAPLLVGDTGVEYGPDISFGAYTQRLLGMGASVPINGIKNFAVGLWDMGAAIFRPSESLSNETNFEYLDIDGSGTYPEPGSGLTSDKIGMALNASINQSNENIRLAKASGNDWSVGWELGNHSLIQATGVGEFAGLSLLSKAGGLVSSASIFNRSTRAEDVFDLNFAPSNIKLGLPVPEGLTARQFDKFSSMIRTKADELGLGDDVFVQGSRVDPYGNPRPLTDPDPSDFDVAIRVSPERFNEIINDPNLVRKRLYSPNPGSSNVALRETAIQDGRIHAGEAKFSTFAKQLEKRFGYPVDISIVRQGGKFDHGYQTPLSFGFDEWK